MLHDSYGIFGNIHFKKSIMLKIWITWQSLSNSVESTPEDIENQCFLFAHKLKHSRGTDIGYISTGIWAIWEY